MALLLPLPADWLILPWELTLAVLSECRPVTVEFWGMRPSHGFISVAGVMPFAPSFDTVGIHASSAEILARVARVLLGSAPSNPVAVTSIHILRDAFVLLEPSVKDAHNSMLEQLSKTFGDAVRETSLIEIVGDEASASFETWYDTYCIMQWSEIENSLGPWIAESKPSFGAATAKNFDLVKNLDRTRVAAAIVQRENLFRKMQEFLGTGDLLCIPTTPSPAPIKGSMGMNQRSGPYYGPALSLTSISGICRLPQISMPLCMVQAEDGNVPLGLSILGKFGEDSFVLDVAQKISLLSPEHST